MIGSSIIATYYYRHTKVGVCRFMDFSIKTIFTWMKMRAATTIRVSDNNIFIQPTQHLCHTICVGSNNDDDQRTTTQQYDLTIIDDKNSSSTDSHRVISSFLYICNLKHQESKSNRKHVHYWKIKPCFPFFHTCIHVIDIIIIIIIDSKYTCVFAFNSIF